MSLAVSAVALVCGCDANHVLGTADPTGAAGTGTTSVLGSTAASSPPGASCSDTQSWTGYIENTTFASGSNTLKLVLPTNPSCPVVGSITFGSGEPLPPATDPDIGYPPGLAPSSYFPHIAEGTPYSLFDPMTSSPGGLRFDIAFGEIWTGWCALQASDGWSSCGHDWTTRQTDTGCDLLDPSTNQWQPIDCGKMMLCNRYQLCRCDAKGCSVGSNPPASYMLGVDEKVLLTFTGYKANGDIIGAPLNGTIHFTKDQ